jgi:alpha-glucosidase (family GH31 glycosyl hydrolase)
MERVATSACVCVCARWCWPGSSSYLDVLSPEVRGWWATNFHPGGYPGATRHLYIWNDMNEPSVFNGPEVRHTCCFHTRAARRMVPHPTC